jgi:hypothetical protein
MSKTVGLFLGVETANWTLQQFTDAAAFAASLGCTVLAIKCQDGTTVWYDSQGGLGAVRAACQKGGLDMVPYAYCYGDKFGGLQGEIAGVKRLMQLRGVAMVDMEEEWDGQTGWASEFQTALLPVPGFLYLTTFANPATANWTGVIAAIRACVNSWVPQEYDNFLVGTESQFPSGLVMQPAINLPESWPGPNDPVAAAKTAIARGHDGVWLWELQLAKAAPDVVKAIATVLNPPPPPPPPPVEAEEDEDIAGATADLTQIKTLVEQLVADALAKLKEPAGS